MTGSFIFRSAFVLAAVVICAAGTADALDRERAISQYVRDRWDSDAGFPGGAVYSITQGSDGYLWIAAEKGLVRFDGLRFHVMQPREITADVDSTIIGLAAGDGGLWALLRRAALVRVRGNEFEHVLANRDRPNSMVTAMGRTAAGIVVVDVNRGVLLERSNAFDVLVEPDALPASFVMSVAQTSDGILWLGTRDSGLLRVEGGRVGAFAEGLPDQKINTLLSRRGAPELWIGTDAGIAIWNGSAITQSGVPPAVAGVQVLAMLEDRDANIWIGTASSGLLRFDSQARVSRAVHMGNPADTVTSLYEDRDGNLWVGTNRGLERFRDAAFTTYSVAEGLPSERIGVVYADAVSNTWFAPLEGGLFCLRDGRVVPIAKDGLDKDVVYSITGDADGVWIGRQRGGLTRIALREGGDIRRFTQADGLAQNSVYTVFRALDGAIWAGTLSGGVSRFHAGRFTTYTVAHGLASNMVAAITETAGEAMWFATPNGISRFGDGTWRRFTVSDGLPSNEATALLPDSAGRLWIGTAAGLALLDRPNQPSIRQIPLPTRTAVLSLTEDVTGSLWIVTADGILRADRDQLAMGRLEAREFARADGLLSRQGVRRAGGISIDARGRVWIATQRGLSVTDPRSSAGRAAPGLVRIEDISADGVAVDTTRAVQIPPRRQRIRFGYAGLSLAVPERIAFRYRLDGFDRDWSEPSTRREAEYTNLRPGTYRFRVTASNSDGVWSGSEASVPFKVQPSVWQTQTFQFAVIALAGAASWGLYRLRLRHVANRLNERFEERLAERTRIARELHDTLLQGVLSASMQLHVLADRVPADSPERPALDRVVGLIRRVVDEGRNAIRGLRTTSTTSDDLEDAFSGIPQELALTESPGYRVIVDGRPKRLNPVIRDEVYCIGREALVNAFRHAQASHVELELEYASELRVCVRDDGRGIDTAVLQAGSDGHWGLIGMRERAQRIGGRLTVWSREAAGTEIELLVPGKVAYREPRL